MSMFPKFLKPHFYKNHSQYIKLSGYYNTKPTVLKVFKSMDILDKTTFVATLDSKVANTGYMDVGNMALNDVDGFRPIEPTDTSIEMPPATPVF